MTKYTALILLVLSLAIVGCEPEAKTDIEIAQEIISPEPVPVIAEEIVTPEPTPVIAKEQTPKLQDTIDLNIEIKSDLPAIETKVIELPIIQPTVEVVKVETPDNNIENETAQQVAKTEAPKEKTPALKEEAPKPVKIEKPKETPKKDQERSGPSLEDTEFFKNCDFIFKNFVDKNGKVNYLTLRRKKLDLLAATKKLGNLPTEMRLSWSKNDEKAFLLNAHNILMVKLIIDNYPIKPKRWASIFYPANSIKQIPGSREKNFYRVAGFRYTIDELEQELLETSSDPRFCFALSNATVSGGILRNEAYHPDKLDKQLDEQAKKYLSNPNNLKIDSSQKLVHLSSIFKLKNFKEAFLKSKFATIKRFREMSPETKAVMNFVFLNIDPKKAKEIEVNSYDVEYMTYNWLLNDHSSK